MQATNVRRRTREVFAIVVTGKENQKVAKRVSPRTKGTLQSDDPTRKVLRRAQKLAGKENPPK